MSEDRKQKNKNCVSWPLFYRSDVQLALNWVESQGQQGSYNPLSSQ